MTPEIASGPFLTAGMCGTSAGPFTPASLTEYLHQHIPLMAAMGLRAEIVDWQEIRLMTPIAGNLNHNRTAFGGSLASALTMAGWSMAHNRLRSCGFYAEQPQTQLVVSRSETRYLRPTNEDFTVSCRFADDRAWDHFLECLTRKGRGKLRLDAWAGDEGDPLCRFKASYVAIAD